MIHKTIDLRSDTVTQPTPAMRVILQIYTFDHAHRS